MEDGKRWIRSPCALWRKASNGASHIRSLAEAPEDEIGIGEGNRLLKVDGTARMGPGVDSRRKADPPASLNIYDSGFFILLHMIEKGLHICHIPPKQALIPNGFVELPQRSWLRLRSLPPLNLKRHKKAPSRQSLCG